MNQEISFIDQLLEEAEAKEISQRHTYIDLLLLEISKLNTQIEKIFNQAKAETDIINNWALTVNSKLQDKITFIEQKLEAFIREENVKTLDLANGIIKLYKKPDTVQISDMDLFLNSASSELLNLIPESIKPDLNKIKAFIKAKSKIPEGVTVITGTESFSIKLKTNNREN